MIYLGNNKIGTIYSGENKIDKIYKGEELVYTADNLPKYYVLATDDDFSGTFDGGFKYTGNGIYIIIPKIIKGVTITKLGRKWTEGYYFPETKYEGMFQSNRNLKGIATEKGHILNTQYMFYGNSNSKLIEIKYLNRP